MFYKLAAETLKSELDSTEIYPVYYNEAESKTKPLNAKDALIGGGTIGTGFLAYKALGKGVDKLEGKARQNVRAARILNKTLATEIPNNSKETIKDVSSVKNKLMAKARTFKRAASVLRGAGKATTILGTLSGLGYLGKRYLETRNEDSN